MIVTICSTCGRDEECRPYGVDDAPVCFDCGMADIETTKANFGEKLNASKDVLLTEAGPLPTKLEWHIKGDG